MSDPRPCQGINSNICVAEGCYREACRRLADPERAAWLEFWAKVRATVALLALCGAILAVLGGAAALLFAAVVP